MDRVGRRRGPGALPLTRAHPPHVGRQVAGRGPAASDRAARPGPVALRGRAPADAVGGARCEQQAAAGVLQDGGEPRLAQLAQNPPRRRRRGEHPGRRLRQLQVPQARVRDQARGHRRVGRAQEAGDPADPHGPVAAGDVVDEDRQGARQRSGREALQGLHQLVRRQARVQGSAHRLRGESHREGPAARLDGAGALEELGQDGGGAPRDDRREVGLDEERLHRRRQVPRQRRLEGLQQSGVGLRPGGRLVGSARQGEGQHPSGAREGAAAGRAEQLGLRQDRRHRAGGDGAPRPGVGEGGANPRRGGRGALRQGLEQHQDPTAQPARPRRLDVVAEHRAQGAVVGAGADQPGRAGAARPRGGQPGPALGQLRPRPVGGGTGRHPGLPLGVQAEQPGGGGQFDEGRGRGGREVEGLRRTGQGPGPHSARAQDRGALAAPLGQQGGGQAHQLLGGAGALVGDGGRVLDVELGRVRGAAGRG